MPWWLFFDAKNCLQNCQNRNAVKEDLIYVHITIHVHSVEFRGGRGNPKKIWILRSGGKICMSTTCNSAVQYDEKISIWGKLREGGTFKKLPHTHYKIIKIGLVQTVSIFTAALDDDDVPLKTDNGSLF
jgi:hypothetical protein